MKQFVFLLAFVTVFLACSKDNDSQPEPEPDPQEEGFDINNPDGYCIVMNFTNTSAQDETVRSLRLYQFLPDNKVKSYKMFVPNQETEYSMIDERTIGIGEDRMRITIESEEITSIRIQSEEVDGDFYLIKNADQNVLAGNTYTGSYKIDGVTILHPNFFYGFHENELKVDAGLEAGTVLRTEVYESIGNFAAYAETVNPEDATKTDKELMIWLEGKLEVNYWDELNGDRYFGTFTKQ